MKKSIIKLGFLFPIAFLPIVSIVSCSKNDKMQNQANKIYLDIYKQLNTTNSYGMNKYYANSVYDKETFLNFTESNPIKNIENNTFDYFFLDFNYSNAHKGELKFQLILKDKKGKSYLPKPDIKDNNAEYFSNIFTITGFKNSPKELTEKIEKTYKDLNQDENQFSLNEKGIQWIEKNKDNLEENIFFDRDHKDNENYFLNFINVPNIIQDNNLSIYEFNVNILNQKPIIKENDKIIIKFWITLATKANTKNDLEIPFSILPFGFEVESSNNLKKIEHNIKIN